MRVLLLENNQAFGVTIKECLEAAYGCEVVFVNTTNMSVDTALSHASAVQPDVVLADCRWDDTDKKDVRGISFIGRWNGPAVLMSSMPVTGFDGIFASKLEPIKEMYRALQRASR